MNATQNYHFSTELRACSVKFQEQ